MDALVPGYNFLGRLDQKPDTEQHMLRIAVYDPGYETLAHSHTDRGPITLHVAESEPGLKLIAEQKLYQAKPDTALVFYGLQAMALTREFKPTLHKVVSPNGNPNRRWVVVFFTSIKSTLITTNSARWLIRSITKKSKLIQNPECLSIAFRVLKYAKVCLYNHLMLFRTPRRRTRRNQNCIPFPEIWFIFINKHHIAALQFLN